MVKSATRVLDLLEVLAVAPEALTLSALARRLAIPKSSALALLATLTKRGYVTREGGHLYRLTASAAARGWVGGPYAGLLAAAAPVMRALVEETKETAFLATLTPDGHVQYLDKVVSPQVVRYDRETTCLGPAHATSLGKVMLAFLPEQEVIEKLRRLGLPRLTDRTVTSLPALLDELRRIRTAGVTVNVDERAVGASGVAAPIRSGSGHVVAALNISAPTVRFHRVRPKLIRAVVQGASDISRQLGYRVAGGRGSTENRRRHA